MSRRERACTAAFTMMVITASLLAVLPSTAIAVRPVLETFMTGLDWPVAIAVAPDGRIFFAEYLSGRIRIIENGALLPDPFYTLTNTSTNLGQGLLGLALHPRFADDPWVYAYHTFTDLPNSTTYNRVVRIKASGNTGEYHHVVIDRIPAGAYHNGGVIEFGPDETLYVLLGEALGPESSQDLGARSGKVLRMNPDGSAPYSNPFWGGSAEDDYVFTYGHRNMFGIAFHPTTGRAYGTDNGPECNDEVNLLLAGHNYGWGPGHSCSTPPPPPGNTNRDGPSPVQPIAWYGSSIAPTNAIIYGGPYFARWRGDFIFGDWNTGSLRRLDLEAPDYDRVNYEETILTIGPQGILDVQVGPDGTIWLTSPTTIYHLTDAARPPTASLTFSPSGLLVNETVVFDGSSSFDSDGNIVSYLWDFGDGARSSGAITVHAYHRWGAYRVTLMVTDDDDLSDSISYDVTVNAPPIASFSASPTTAHIGQPIRFVASGSKDPNGAVVQFEWDFGDGTSARGPEVTHSYSSIGRFAVSLSVVDDTGSRDSMSRSVTILNRPPNVSARSPEATNANVFAGDVLLLAVLASDPDGQTLRYRWSIDGAEAGASGPTLELREARVGSRVVEVVISDGFDQVRLEWTVNILAANIAPPYPLTVPSMALAVISAGILSLVFWRLSRREKN